MPQRPQKEPCKKSDIIDRCPASRVAFQTPGILMARLLFHVVGINHDAAAPCRNRGARPCGRVLHHFLYCVNNVGCMWGWEGGERALRAFITGSELYGGEERVSGGAGRQTPPLSFLSFLHRLRQRLWRIYIISVRHRVQSVCTAALGGAKFDPGKHSSRHMLLFVPSERLMGLIRNFSGTEL